MTDEIKEPGGGGNFHMRSTRGVPRVRVILSRKNSENSMSIFHKNSGKGYNICKKLLIGSVILMTQMTNQNKINYSKEAFSGYPGGGYTHTALETV